MKLLDSGSPVRQQSTAALPWLMS